MSRLTLTQATAVAITGLVTGLTLGHTAGVIARADAADEFELPMCTPEIEALDDFECIVDDQEQPGAAVVATPDNPDGIAVTASQADRIAAAGDPKTMIYAIRLESVASRLRAQLAKERRQHRVEVAGLRSQLVNDATVRRAIRVASVTYRVPERDILRVARCESRMKATAVGPRTRAGRAVGLMQFMPGTWRTTRYRTLPPTDPYASALAAASIVRREGWRQWECRP